MKVYTIWADVVFEETAEIAGKVLGRWLHENNVGCRDITRKRGVTYVDFVAGDDTYATFCATTALAECGLTDFPVGIRQGHRIIRMQRGTEL